MAGKFEIYKDKSGKYRWRLTHTSGMVIAKSGESYPTKVHAIKTIWSALANTNGRQESIVRELLSVKIYHCNVIFPASIL